MQQVSCSRAKAVRVLKESGGDLINASMSFCSLLSSPIVDTIFSSYGSQRVVTGFHHHVHFKIKSIFQIGYE